MNDLPVDVPGTAPTRMLVWAVVRVVGTIVGLVALYYLLPLQRLERSPTSFVLAVALIGLTILIAVQVRAIVRSPRPRLRAVEALASTIPLLVLSFATSYYLLSSIDPENFVVPLTRTDALYFTVTVFATVGFGDITPVSQTARVAVTIQMLVNLLVLGIGLRVILGAIQVGRDRQGSAR